MKRYSRQLFGSVIGISLVFMVCGTPMLWNKMRQLAMSYSYQLLLDAQESGAGEIYNYEYYIVNFVLSFNNCINFIVYLMTGSTWRKQFLQFIRDTLSRRL